MRSLQSNAPGGYLGNYRPHCGADLPVEPQFAASGDESKQINWREFFIILFLPPAVTFLALAANLMAIAVIAALAGSVVSGIVCARMVMKRTMVSGVRRVLFHIVAVILLSSLSLIVSGLGCAAGAVVGTG